MMNIFKKSHVSVEKYEKPPITSKTERWPEFSSTQNPPGLTEIGHLHRCHYRLWFQPIRKTHGTHISQLGKTENHGLKSACVGHRSCRKMVVGQLLSFFIWAFLKDFQRRIVSFWSVWKKFYLDITVEYPSYHSKTPTLSSHWLLIDPQSGQSQGHPCFFQVSFEIFPPI